MATGQPTKICGYTVLSGRAGYSGEYVGCVADQTGVEVHRTRRYRGRGAKDRAFQDARLWAQAHPVSVPCSESVDSPA